MPVFDRKVEFDVRSYAFRIRTLVAAKPPRSYTWTCGPRLDQGREGACVGFAFAHELAARPLVVKDVTASTAKKIYRRAQELDSFPGEDYEGTSVLAGAKVLREMGRIKEYRWAFGLDDLVLAVGYKGPAVIGVNWYEGMVKPDATNTLRIKGDVVGGHAILVNGVDVKRERFRVHNSWGADWGKSGEAWLTFGAMRRLLSEDGDACIPVGRK